MLRYYKLYNFFSNFLIFIPVLVVIYNIRGITTADILIIESFYNITIAIFEIPTGYLGDKLGHDRLVIIGLVGTFLSYILFAFSYTLPLIIISQVLLGLFSTCMSGSDIGSLSEYLDSIGQGDNIDVHKSLYAIGIGSMLLSYIMSGFVVVLNEKFIFIIEGIVYLIATLFYYLFSIGKRKCISEGNSKKKFEERKKENKSEEKLYVIDIVACGVLFGALSSTYLVSQLFYNNVNVSKAFFGFIYCVSSIMGMIFSKLKRNLNIHMIYLIPCLFLIPIVKNKLMVIPFIILSAYLKAKIYPFVNNYLSYHTKNRKALSLSISNMINHCINGVMMLSLSGLVYKFGFSISMISLAILVACLLTFMLKNGRGFKEELAIK